MIWRDLVGKRRGRMKKTFLVHHIAGSKDWETSFRYLIEQADTFRIIFQGTSDANALLNAGKKEFLSVPSITVSPWSILSKLPFQRIIKICQRCQIKNGSSAPSIPFLACDNASESNSTGLSWLAGSSRDEGSRVAAPIASATG